MGGKPRTRAASNTELKAALVAYQAARARAQLVWEIYDGQPSEHGASADAIAKLQAKFGAPLPAGFEAFMELHDGWEGYEYDRHILSSEEILSEQAADSLETNLENIDEDEADTLANVFVVGCDNGTATILYFDSTKSPPEVVEYYCEELGRWPSFTDYIRELTTSINEGLASEDAQKASTLDEWNPTIRAERHASYQSKLAERLQAAPPPKRSPSFDVENLLPQIANIPKQPGDLKSDGLQVYLGFEGYMLYTPSAEEVTAAAHIFRKFVPWSGRTLACAASDEYSRKSIPPDTRDYSEFLNMQSGGHFGLRMTDDEGKKKTSHIFNFRGVPHLHGEAAAAFLEILLPVDYDAASMRALILELAEALPLVHGYAGFFALPQKLRSHMKTMHEWCRAHWALQIADDDFLVPALTGPLSAGWLTLLDNETIETIRKSGRTLPANQIHQRKRACVLEIGDKPDHGDVRVAFPRAHAELAQALGPVLSPDLSELTHFDEYGATQAWLQRFEAPAVFAVTPQDLLESVKEAVKSNNCSALSDVLGQLDHREEDARSCLRTQLSVLGHESLAEKDDASIALYDWLTSLPKPRGGNLINSLVAAWHRPADAKRFIERALPYAEEYPAIFHNVIGLHVEHGNFDAAIEVARKSESFYTVKLFKLLTTDTDFAPAFKRAEFVEFVERIRSRLGLTQLPSLIRSSEWEQRVGESPGEVHVYRDYAAWLSSHNDSRGALILAHIDESEQPRVKAVRTKSRTLLRDYIRNRLLSKFASLEDKITRDEFRWGVLDRLYLSGWHEALHEAGLALLKDPECFLLRTLYLPKMSVDLAQIAESVPHLTDLNLRGSTLTNLSSVTQFRQLETLYLTGTDVVDLSELRGMEKLRKLYLKSTKVSDLSPLTDLPSLEFINLEGSSVTNIKPLFALPRLCELWLYKTKIPKSQAEQAEQIIKASNIEPGSGVSKMVYGP